MKIFQIFSLLTVLAAGIFFGSCEKVIDVDLNKEDPKIVIEGRFTAGETASTVLITRTLNFDETGPYPTIDNAVVTVIDNLGNAQVLTFSGNGIYTTNGYPIVEGRSYTVSVTVDGTTYTATSTVPSLIEIDTLKILDIAFGPDTIHALIPARYDAAGVANYYQFDIYRNGERVPGIFLQNDDFTDGILVEEPLFAEDIESGDTALVNMYCIDQPVFNYFFALLQNETATPANPTSNFSGGCLGYFSARTKHTATVIIP
jgi:hypothetical protein